MAGGGPGNPHRRADVNTAVVFAVTDNRPGAVLFHDFDDAVAMRGHFDFGLCLCQFLIGCDVREHEMLIGVFVIDGQQSAIAVCRSGGQWQITDIVAVISKLFCLGRGRLVHRIECRCAGFDRVAPAQKHFGVVSRRDMMGRVIDVGRFGKAKG